MKRLPVSSWEWLSEPGIKIENGFLLRSNSDRNKKPYCPGNYVLEIISSVQMIYSTEDVLRFVKNWGILGSVLHGTRQTEIASWLQGAIFYAYSTQSENTYAEVAQRIISDYTIFHGALNVEKLADTSLMVIPLGEKVADVTEFAERIRFIINLRWLLKLFEEDPHLADYEAKTWLENNISSFSKLHSHRGNLDHSLHNAAFKSLFSAKLTHERELFAPTGQNGAYLKISVQGNPELHFDSLSRFIEYNVLLEATPSPVRCSDPKCQQLFVPAREGQRYCPPLTGEKRSRCEQRHSQELRRKKDGGSNR